jgi:hypothetical protein
MIFADSLTRPSGNGLPNSQRKHQSGKNLPHPSRLETLCQPSSKDASDKNPRDQKQPCLPRNVPGLGIREKREHARRWNQRYQAGALRAMLPKSKKQHQERD